MIATRRTAQTQIFSTVDSVDLAIAEGQTVAQGGHLLHPVLLNDMLLAEGEGKFTVRGRAADVVKIGGSRNSLAALTAELNRVPGVIDGVFWLPEPTSGETRLTAFAVAPGVNRAAIIAHLRGRIDPLFLPRPLILVDSLPRNVAGKLTRDALKGLAQSSQDWQSVPVSHPALSGHFPGNPVVPGAWLLALVERAVRHRIGIGFRVLGVPDATFRSALRPEELFRILLDEVAPDRLAFRIEGEATLVADGTFVMEAAS